MPRKNAQDMQKRARGKSGSRKKSLLGDIGDVVGAVRDLMQGRPDYDTNETSNHKGVRAVEEPGVSHLSRKSDGMPAPAPRLSVQAEDFKFKRNQQMPQRRKSSKRQDGHKMYRMLGETELHCSDAENFVLKMLEISIPEHLNGPHGSITLQEVRTTLETAIEDALRMNQDFLVEELRGRVKTLFLEFDVDVVDNGFVEKQSVYWQFFFMPSKVSKHLKIFYSRMRSAGAYRAVAADIKRDLQEAVVKDIMDEHNRQLEERRRNMREPQRRPQAILPGGRNSMETDAFPLGAVGSGFRQSNNAEKDAFIAGHLSPASALSKQNGSHKPMGGASHHALPAGGVGLALESSPHQPVLSHASGGVAHRPAIQGGELAPYPGHAEGGFSGGVGHHGAIHGGEVAPYAGDVNRAQQRYRTLPESGRDLMLRRSMEEDEESMQSL